MEFSKKTRELSIKKMQERTLDLLIIGGGITGAGVALQAAASGLETGLIEMQDFAEGTSSRSTKLVHGYRIQAHVNDRVLAGSSPVAC